MKLWIRAAARLQTWSLIVIVLLIAVPSLCLVVVTASSFHRGLGDLDIELILRACLSLAAMSYLHGLILSSILSAWLRRVAGIEEEDPDAMLETPLSRTVSRAPHPSDEPSRSLSFHEVYQAVDLFLEEEEERVVPATGPVGSTSEFPPHGPARIRHTQTKERPIALEFKHWDRDDDRRRHDPERKPAATGSRAGKRTA